MLCGDDNDKSDDENVCYVLGDIFSITHIPKANKLILITLQVMFKIF